MSYSFEGPVGAAADAKELEYIAALIQTSHADKEGFVDASIDARDIKYYLMSRFGIEMSREQVRKIILAGLGGGEDEDDCLDLCEVVAALLIPSLRKIVDENFLLSSDSAENATKTIKDVPLQEQAALVKAQLADDQSEDERVFLERVSPEEIIRFVLENILKHATGSSEPQPLTKELIRTIFAAFDETALVTNEELVSEMIAAAKDSNAVEDTEDTVLLDVKAFARALTADVMLYDPSVEKRATTNFVDAFGTLDESSQRAESSSTRNTELPDDPDNFQDNSHGQGLRKLNNVIKDEITNGLDDSVIAVTEHGPVSKKFTLSTIDFAVDNFRSKTQLLLVWFGFLCFFARYLSSGLRPRGATVCSGSGFGCKISQSVFNWVVLMLLLSLIGIVYFISVGSGNDVYRRSYLDIVVGVAGVVVFLILPLQFSTESLGDWKNAFFRVVFIIIASLTLVCQCLNAARLSFSDEFIGSNKFLSRILAGSNARDEMKFKSAAVFKVNRMLENAYSLHHPTHSRGEVNEGTNELALLNFTKVSDKTEVVGGFKWAWKSFLNGDLKRKEGIWLQTRLIAGLMAQLLFSIIAIIILSTNWHYVIGLYKDDTTYCSISFNPESCYAPEVNGTSLGIAACTDIMFEGDGCDGSKIDIVSNVELFNLTCQFIPPNPATNETVCDSVFFYEDHYATFEGELTNNEVCQAQLTTCVFYENNTAACLLGLKPQGLIPWRFEGPGCESIPLVEEIIDTRPALFADAEAFVDESIDDYIPKRWMVVLCAVVSLITGCFVAISLFANYIPSTVCTIMKFRSGAIPSLRDPNFIQYRKTLESVTYIIGLMAWGTWSSIFFTVVVVAGGVFFLVYQVTRPIVVSIVAIVIGITVTLVFKSILITVLGRVNYAAFYRKRPWLANICGVGLECWHLGLSSGYMLSRAIKLIVAATMYIGRIDQPFLGEGVGVIGGTHLDKFPSIYRQGLLSADAHRHPYIERLGLIYLLKIRHGSKFGTTAGSIWRLLFVFSLMPWLRKFRIANDADIPEEIVMLQLTSGSNTKYEKIIKDLQEELNEEKSRLEKEIRILQGKIKMNQGDANAETNLDNLLEMISNLQHKIDSAGEEKEKQNSLVRSLEHEMSELQQTKSKIENDHLYEVMALKKELSEAVLRKDELMKERDELMKNNTDLIGLLSERQS
mmetsp:Transcript_177/g.328  ORF Transcript_177/g.328 Transcript_177/m.328 type:complete len:1179 (+) Transcript_177:143-3679(+)